MIAAYTLSTLIHNRQAREYICCFSSASKTDLKLFFCSFSNRVFRHRPRAESKKENNPLIIIRRIKIKTAEAIYVSISERLSGRTMVSSLCSVCTVFTFPSGVDSPKICTIGNRGFSGFTSTTCPFFPFERRTYKPIG